jgi:hypothetical protein
MSNCKHRNRTLTGRIRPIAWPPKREYKCRDCNKLAWESFFPAAYLNVLRMQHALPHIVEKKGLTINV